LDIQTEKNLILIWEEEYSETLKQEVVDEHRPPTSERDQSAHFLFEVFSASSSIKLYFHKKREGKILVYFRFSINQLPAMLIMTAMMIAKIMPISALIAPTGAASPCSP
jgi:hypothetical protein